MYTLFVPVAWTFARARFRAHVLHNENKLGRESRITCLNGLDKYGVTIAYKR